MEIEGHPDILAAFMPLTPQDEVNRCFHWVHGSENIEAILKTGHVDIDCFGAGHTRLFKAVESHDYEAMQLLLQYEAGPNRRCSQERFGCDRKVTHGCDHPRGPMPIHAFAGFGQRRHIYDESNAKNAEKCLQLLLENGADINATTDDKSHQFGKDKNFTALHYAVKKDSDHFGWGMSSSTEEKLAVMLLKPGADPNARSAQGNAPIHFANTEQLGLFDVLTAHSADINAKNDQGRTPLLQLITQYNAKPNIKVFEKLIECGADVNTSD